MWVESYSYPINPMFGSSMWKKAEGVPTLPPIGRKMPGRPKKKRIRHPSEDNQLVG